MTKKVTQKDLLTNHEMKPVWLQIPADYFILVTKKDMLQAHNPRLEYVSIYYVINDFYHLFFDA